VTGWLLDTNILSELRRPRPNAKVVGFVAAQPLDLLFVSIVTFAEIRFGIERVADATRRAELNDWLTHRLRPMFEERALAVSEDIMFKWRLLVEEGRKAGHTFSQPGSHHRRHRAPTRPHRRHPRRQRFPQRAGTGSRSLAGGRRLNGSPISYNC
jgi:toxin FitB